MFRTQLRSFCLMVTLFIGGLCTMSIVRSEQEASVIAPVVGGLISGGITNYALSQATVESEREWANAIMYYYQNHLAIYSMDTINRAYRILSSTDEQLKSELYWRKIFGSVGAGISVAALLYCMLNNASSSVRMGYKVDVSYPLYYPSYYSYRIAAPYYIG